MIKKEMYKSGLALIESEGLAMTQCTRSKILAGVIPVFVLSAVFLLPSTGATNESCEATNGYEFICNIPSAEDLLRIGDSNFVITGGMGRPDWSHGGFSFVNITTRAHYEASPDFASEAIALYRSCPGAPDPSAFSVHGISLRQDDENEYTVYAVNHGGRESVEVFNLSLKGERPSLRWQGCVILPEGLAANSVTYLADNALAVTANPQLNESFASEALSSASQAADTGGVYEWRLTDGWKMVPNSEVSVANGILASADNEWLYVVGWANGVIRKINRFKPSTPASETKTRFLVDNLRYLPDGRILATGQRTTPVQLLQDCVLTSVPVCRVDTVVALLDPKTMTHEEVAEIPASKEFGSGTAAISIGGELWVGTFRGTRIAIVKKPLDRI